MKLVLCHGIFEVLHLGHFKLFESAKRMGSMLVVSVVADQFARGFERPLFSQSERVYSLSRCKDIDKVELCYYSTPIPMIEKYQPDIYLTGKDKITDAEKEAVEKLGGKVVLAESIFRIHLRRDR